MSEEHAFVVEKIINKRIKGEVQQYLVKWQGYDDPSDLTWEPIENLQNCKESIDEYERAHKKKKDKTKDKITTIYEAQSYPYAMIKILNDDKLELKYNSTPFKFRRYKRNDKSSLERIKEVDKESKSVNIEIKGKKNAISMDIDYAAMMFPKTLSRWCADELKREYILQ